MLVALSGVKKETISVLPLVADHVGADPPAHLGAKLKETDLVPVPVKYSIKTPENVRAAV